MEGGELIACGERIVVKNYRAYGSVWHIGIVEGGGFNWGLRLTETGCVVWMLFVRRISLHRKRV